MTSPLLEINNLSVLFPSTSDEHAIPAIKNISFSLNQEETLGIIGESGSGKSVTLLSLLGLINADPGIVSGSIVVTKDQNKINLLENIEQYIFYENNSIKINNLSKWKQQRELLYKDIRGSEISMIFQNPKLAFNPFYSIGSQINEMIRLHTATKNKNDAKKVAIEWLSKVKMEAPAIRYNNNPYGLSGGMCQRAMIAMALASQPSILIADEPTTGLDATIQSNIVDLLSSIKKDSEVSMIVVSHDFNVMRELTDRVIVYYKGRIIEEGLTKNIFNEKRKNIHPYTKRLLEANLQGFTDSSSLPETNISRHTGCDFYDMCPSKEENFKNLCRYETPAFTNVSDQHRIRCWRYKNG